jgi:hypothetical protein
MPTIVSMNSPDATTGRLDDRCAVVVGDEDVAVLAFQCVDLRGVERFRCDARLLLVHQRDHRVVAGVIDGQLATEQRIHCIGAVARVLRARLVVAERLKLRYAMSVVVTEFSTPASCVVTP